MLSFVAGLVLGMVIMFTAVLAGINYAVKGSQNDRNPKE